MAEIGKYVQNKTTYIEKQIFVEPEGNVEEQKTIMTAPNGEKYEIMIDDNGQITTKIAETERGMLL